MTEVALSIRNLTAAARDSTSSTDGRGEKEAPWLLLAEKRGNTR